MGFGYDTFRTNYNNVPCDFFSNNINEKREFIANSGLYAFNEYIQILVEKGFVGLVLMTLLIILIVKNFNVRPHKS